MQTLPTPHTTHHGLAGVCAIAAIQGRPCLCERGGNAAPMAEAGSEQLPLMEAAKSCWHTHYQALPSTCARLPPARGCPPHSSHKTTRRSTGRHYDERGRIAPQGRTGGCRCCTRCSSGTSEDVSSRPIQLPVSTGHAGCTCQPLQPAACPVSRQSCQKRCQPHTIF